MIEDPADGAMLDAQFGGRGGNLYEPDGPGANWTQFAKEGFPKKTNQKQADFTDVEAAIAALHAQPGPGSAASRAALEARFDADLFLRWLAVNTAIQNWDTYGAMAHNYYLYGDPGQKGRLRWIPWDNNLALGASFGGFGGRGGFVPGGAPPDPYPGSHPPYYGNLTSTQEKLDALVLRLSQNRIQSNFHANGEVAIDMVLTAFERAAAKHPDLAMRRPKITHCTIVTPELVKRIKAVGVVPNLFATYPFYNSDKFGFYGPAMMDRAMAYRWLLDAGVPATAGSDFPPGPIAPMMGLQGMVTRTGWNGEVWGASQAITPAEGLKVWTVNAAYAAFEEDVKGSITPGKFADLVFLDRDPLTADPQTIKDIKVTRTIVGGRTVYQA